MQFQVHSPSFSCSQPPSGAVCQTPSAAALHARSLEQMAAPELRDDAPEQLLLPSLKTSNHHRSSSRPALCSFLPLPPILASPTCTPTSSINLFSPGDCNSASEGSEDFTAASSSPNCISLRVPFSTPTWTSTPPTPPSKLTRRSSARLSRRTPKSPFSPSASFPASMRPHAANLQGSSFRRGRPGLKRCVSMPIVLERAQAFSEPYFVKGDLSQASNLSGPDFYMRSTAEEPASAEADCDNDEKRARSRTIFHLLHNTDNEDEGGVSFESRPRSLNDETSPDGSWSDHSPEDVWEGEKNKDSLRRFHALKELLETEIGYLMDLKAFVTVYLRNLPTLAFRIPTFNSTFGRASASFTTGPWINSYTQLQAAALSSSSTLPETNGSQSPATSSSKDPPKSNIRYLFTDGEIETLIRNAEEILQLHEYFARELSAALEPLGFSMEHSNGQPDNIENLDSAVRVVSAKFATEASRFNAYQSFCAGHPEALDLVRKVSHQYPLEWEAYERRCSVMISDMLDGGNLTESEPRSNSQDQLSLTTEDRSRALSLTSLDGAVRSLRLRALAKDTVIFPTGPKREGGIPRIAFADYMIKPIQRICKYPLLFNQLLSGKPLRLLSSFPGSRSDVDVVIESAAQAMRHVASAVDEARHKQDAAIQSSLIFSRIFLGSQSLLVSNNNSFQTLTPEFISSLGSCLLAGSLDVMHHHPLTTNFKAKYLGAFLYPGGYIILVKVSKGRKYEPRQWFSLADFTVCDVEECDVMLPFSFRVSCGDQHFELAAACQREKGVWLSAIKESLTQRPTWINEPTPSLKFDDKGELISSFSEDNLSEASSGLPTIQSIPELSNNSDTELSEPFFASLRGNITTKKKMKRYEIPIRSETSPSNSRRSSTTSVKAIFGPTTPGAETIVIRRSSPMARLQIDQGLQDLVSQSCLTARMYAFSREEELFHVPKPMRSGFPRSSSSMSMAGMAKNRLSKHESIRVSRSRTTDNFDALLPKTSLNYQNLATRRNTKKLSITSISLKEYDGKILSKGSSIPPCPSPPPQPSRVPFAVAAVSEALYSPTGLLTPPIAGSADPSSVKSPRSMVRGVKDLFNFRPMPSSSMALQPSPVSARVLEPSSYSGPSVLHRWTIDSIRRHPRSMPDSPEAQFPPTIIDAATSIVPLATT